MCVDKELDFAVDFFFVRLPHICVSSLLSAVSSSVLVSLSLFQLILELKNNENLLLALVRSILYLVRSVVSVWL